MVLMQSKQSLRDVSRSPLIADFPPAQTQLNSSEALVRKPLSQHCQVCVIVPVRNEAQTLTQTLSALAHQVDFQGKPLDTERYEIILLLNNCNDDSAAIAWDFAKRHPDLALHPVEITLPPAEAYIGRVRQLLMDEAYRRFRSLGKQQGIIASTDGDSKVSSNWIAATLHEVTCGADAVGGRIVTDKAERAELDPYARACHLREVGYSYLMTELESYLDPNPFDVFPRHYQHYGASLAVTAQMYALAGGLPPVHTPEDVAFYNALVRVNARFRHSPLVKVITSARQSGRTDLGLANQLREWTKMGQRKESFLVESAAAMETRFGVRHQLRIMWHGILDGFTPNQRDILSIADTFAVSGEWLTQELTQHHTFGQLLERVQQQVSQEGIWTQRWQKVEIKNAIADLRLRLQQLRKPYLTSSLARQTCNV
jgi:glycosyltransferase involved in cell wall biosynthesis